MKNIIIILCLIGIATKTTAQINEYMSCQYLIHSHAGVEMGGPKIKQFPSCRNIKINFNTKIINITGGTNSFLVLKTYHGIKYDVDYEQYQAWTASDSNGRIVTLYLYLYGKNKVMIISNNIEDFYFFLSSLPNNNNPKGGVLMTPSEIFY